MANIIADALKESGQNIRRVSTRLYPGTTDLDYYFMNRETGSVKTNIIEYGFADSERDDVKQLRDDWKIYAEAVVKGFCKYIGHKYVAPSKKATDRDKQVASHEIKKPKANLEVDGYWGKNTTKALQRYFNTTVDGIISNQYKNIHHN